MRPTREVDISQRVLLGTELVVPGLVASGRFGANRSDFEGTVLRIAGMIEPDAERLLAWYRDTPIADIDALTAGCLEHRPSRRRRTIGSSSIGTLNSLGSPETSLAPSQPCAEPAHDFLMFGIQHIARILSANRHHQGK